MVLNTPNDQEYVRLFQECKIDFNHVKEIDRIIDSYMIANKTTYQYVSVAVKYGKRYADYYTYEQNGFCFLRKPEDFSFPQKNFPGCAYRLFLTGYEEQNYLKLPRLISDSSTGEIIPWYFIGCLHYMETSANFKKHLHNGDSLQNFTSHVPKGRPIIGHKPPFTFEESAIDAIKFQNIDAEKNWSLPNILRWFEKYNGTGYYRFHHMNSPYLWSYSNQYTKGKYGSDGKFDSDLVSKQAGCACILKRMEDRKLILIQR